MKSSFLVFCEQATDAQLIEILRKEWEGQKHDLGRMEDYREAVKDAHRRGWAVVSGEVL